MDRPQIQSLLEGLLGSQSVYFQPPPSVVMEYPAIVYSLADIDAIFASNVPYRRSKRYTVTLISRKPDHFALDLLGELPKSTFDNHFATDGLNHYVFAIYF